MGVKKSSGVLFLLCLAILSMTALPAQAASKKSDNAKKKINNVSISVKSNIQAGSKISEESSDVSVDVSGSGFSLTEYTIENQGFTWYGGDVPEIKVVLTADDNYVFNISKTEQLTINGATVKNPSSTRAIGRSSFELELLLPSVGVKLYPVESANFSSECIASWSITEEASYYELKLVKNSSVIGSTHKVNGSSLSLREYITREGNYHFKIRPVKLDGQESFTGDWVDSNTIYVSKSFADNLRKEKEALQSLGSWRLDAVGYWFELPDGTYPSQAWRKINTKWYYFDENGYMAKGWVFYNNYWYYLDEKDGYMWANAETPDGYFVGIDGAYSPK